MLVPMAIAVVIIGVIVVKPGQVQWPPAEPLVDHELPALDRTQAMGIRHTEGWPPEALIDDLDIGPKDGARGLIVLLLKKELGVTAWIAVGVQKKELFE